MEVKEVRDKREVDQFIKFAWEVYRNNPFWVPPNISEVKTFLNGKGRFFDHCRYKLFVLEENGKATATIAAFYDLNFVNHWKKRVGMLGFFESLPGNQEGVKLLFDRAEAYLKGQGAEVVWAPVNGSIANPVGLLMNAFNQMPVFLMSYNPSYYRQYFNYMGYKPKQYLVAYTIDLLDDRLHRKVSYVLHRARNSEIKIRPFDRQRFREESNLLARLYATTFKDHWGYAPQSDEEVYELLNPLKLVLESDFILFAEHKGVPIGFTLASPDYNPTFKKLSGNFEFLNAFSFLYLTKKIREGRLIAIGVIPEWRGKKVAPLLVASVYDAMIRKSYHKCEYSWVFQENISSHNVIQKFESDDYKQYCIYEKLVS